MPLHIHIHACVFIRTLLCSRSCLLSRSLWAFVLSGQSSPRLVVRRVSDRVPWRIKEEWVGLKNQLLKLTSTRVWSWRSLRWRVVVVDTSVFWTKAFPISFWVQKALFLCPHSPRKTTPYVCRKVPALTGKVDGVGSSENSHSSLF